jgi:hypothetical protein
LGSFENATIPAILWLRTARELVPVQHCSKKTWGKFSSSHVSLGVSSAAVVVFVVALVAVFFVATLTTTSKSHRQWKRHTGVAMARSYGEESVSVTQLGISVDLFNPDAQRVYGSTQERMKVLVALVMAEWHEQEARARVAPDELGTRWDPRFH